MSNRECRDYRLDAMVIVVFLVTVLVLEWTAIKNGIDGALYGFSLSIAGTVVGWYFGKTLWGKRG